MHLKIYQAPFGNTIKSQEYDLTSLYLRLGYILTEYASVPKVLWEDVTVYVNRAVVSKDSYEKRFIHHTDDVQIHFHIGGLGGGAFPAENVRLALGVVSTFGAQLIGGAIGGVGGRIVAGALGAGGLLATAALIPPSSEAIEDLTPSIQGIRNQFRPYQPIPIAYGKIRMYPDLAAQPYTEIVGGEQYIRALFCFGYGPRKISDIRIGNVPIKESNLVYEDGIASVSNGVITLLSHASDSPYEYLDFVIEITSGPGAGQRRVIYDYNANTREVFPNFAWNPVPDSSSEVRITEIFEHYKHIQMDIMEGREHDRVEESLYANTVEELNVDVELLENEGYTVRETESNTDEISIILVLPNGLRIDRGPGDHVFSFVKYQIQYRRMEDGVPVNAQWYPVTRAVRLHQNEAETFTTDQLYDFFEGQISNLGDILANIQFIINDDPNDARIPQSVINWLLAMLEGNRQRIEEFRALSQMIENDPNQSETLNDLEQVLLNLGNLINSLGPTIQDNVTDRMQDYVDDMFRHAPALYDLIHINRTIQQGNFIDLSESPWFNRWLINRWGLDHLAGGMRPLVSGSIGGSSPDKVSLTGSGVSSEDGAYVDYLILVRASNNKQTRRIIAYDGASKTATVDRAWHESFSIGTPFDIYEAPGISQIQGRETGTVWVSHTWGVPRGQYQIRIRRVTEDHGDPERIDRIDWYKLQSIKKAPPVQMEGLTLIAVRIKATDQFKGMLEQFNAVVESELPVYDGSEWHNEVTSNPAWVFVDIATGKANPNPIPIELLDIDAIKEWADDLGAEEFPIVDAATKIGREYNIVIRSRGNVPQRLEHVASVGRASFFINQDGLYTVAQDTAQANLKTLVTSRVAWGISWGRNFRETPHAIRARFQDESKDYVTDDYVVFNDGYDIDNAALYETIEYPGTTSHIQAYKDARFHLAELYLRNEVISFNIDMRHMLFDKLDKIGVQTDSVLFGTSSGRIVDLIEQGGQYIEVVIDETLDFDNEDYAVHIENDLGHIIYMPITNKNETTNSLTPESPISDISKGALVAIGIIDRAVVPCLVKSIRYNSDLTAHVEAVIYNEDIYDVNLDEIPDREPHITIRPEENPFPPPMPAIKRVSSAGTIRGADGVIQQVIDIQLEQTPLANRSKPDSIECRYAGTQPIDEVIQEALWAGASSVDVQRAINEFNRNPPLLEAPKTDADTLRTRIYNVEEDQQYMVRIRYVSANGLVSEWRQIFHTTELIEGDIAGIKETIEGLEDVTLEVARNNGPTMEGGIGFLMPPESNVLLKIQAPAVNSSALLLMRHDDAQVRAVRLGYSSNEHGILQLYDNTGTERVRLFGGAAFIDTSLLELIGEVIARDGLRCESEEFAELLQLNRPGGSASVAMEFSSSGHGNVFFGAHMVQKCISAVDSVTGLANGKFRLFWETGNIESDGEIIQYGNGSVFWNRTLFNPDNPTDQGFIRELIGQVTNYFGSGRPSWSMRHRDDNGGPIVDFLGYDFQEQAVYIRDVDLAIGGDLIVDGDAFFDWLFVNNIQANTTNLNLRSLNGTTRQIVHNNGTSFPTNIRTGSALTTSLPSGESLRVHNDARVLRDIFIDRRGYIAVGTTSNNARIGGIQSSITSVQSTELTAAFEWQTVYTQSINAGTLVFSGDMLEIGIAGYVTRSTAGVLEIRLSGFNHVFAYYSTPSPGWEVADDLYYEFTIKVRRQGTSTGNASAVLALWDQGDAINERRVQNLSITSSSWGSGQSISLQMQKSTQQGWYNHTTLGYLDYKPRPV
jgi:hypothetical protein